MNISLIKKTIAKPLMATLLVYMFAGGALSASAQTFNEPMISGVLAYPTNNSVTIIWTTDEIATSQVSYGTSLPYRSSGPYDANPMKSHAVVITGLQPNTTYHYRVTSSDQGNSTQTSQDATFTTLANNSTTNNSTPNTTQTSIPATNPATITNANPTYTYTTANSSPAISSIVVTPTATGATITWTTDQNANSQINYGPSLPYNTSTTLNTNSGTYHSETITGLSPNTQYHFSISGTNNAGQVTMSPDQTFTTLMSSPGTTTNVTQTQFDTLLSEIAWIKNQIIVLENQISNLLNRNQNNYGNGSSSSQPTSSTAMIDQNGQTFGAGSSMDFGGHRFIREEQVNISLNGTAVGTAHADREGNFSTGSISLPTTPGTYTYTFTGANGDSTTSTITVR